MEKISYILVHHSGTDDDGFQNNTKAILDYHVNEKHYDDIGYNFLIEKVNNELVLQVGRPLSIPGAHCRAKHHNFDSVGICVVGNFSQENIPADYWHKLVNVISGLLLLFDIPVKNVIGHREAEPGTECPGKNIDMNALRRAVAKKLINRRTCFLGFNRD